MKIDEKCNFLPPLNFLGQPPLPLTSKIRVGEASRVGRRNELLYHWTFVHTETLLYSFPKFVNDMCIEIRR